MGRPSGATIRWAAGSRGDVMLKLLNGCAWIVIIGIILLFVGFVCGSWWLIDSGGLSKIINAIFIHR